MLRKTFRFTRDEFDESLKPAVYAVIVGNDPVYVGYTSQGYRRIFMDDRCLPNRQKAFSECDSVEIIVYDSKEEAAVEELNLIHRYHPKYNVVCMLCGGFYKGSAPEDILSDHPYVKIAKSLVEEFGGIPTYNKLRDLGLHNFYCYVRTHRSRFSGFLFLPKNKVPLESL